MCEAPCFLFLRMLHIKLSGPAPPVCSRKLLNV